jgi:hypothetical protein
MIGLPPAQRVLVCACWTGWWLTVMKIRIVYKGQKFFASFFQKRSSFLKERTKELLPVYV